MCLTQKKVNRRFTENIWPSFSKRRPSVKESGVEKLCSGLFLDYFTIIKKVVKNDLSLAAEKWLCPPCPGFKFSVKTKISQEILNRQAWIYANYAKITAGDFLESADVILSLCYVEDRNEIEVISFSWSDFKLAEELGGLRYFRTNYGFDNPQIAEYFTQLVHIMSQTN